MTRKTKTRSTWMVNWRES